MSWFGGLVGGVGGALVVIVRRRWPILKVVAAAAPALAVGQAIGRIGCFLVGDDYGRPTSLPWGVAFPNGFPPTIERVHPTQLYEMLALLALAALLVRWRRRGEEDRVVVAWYLLIAGLVRFLVEFVRVNPPSGLGLTEAQWIAGAAVVAGGVLVVTHKS
jgi:phosphatidylglycerol:prolipoprotein diacylglycerol transferase